MAFNFKIKKQSYDTALSQAKQCFLEDDLVNGKYYISCALQLSYELISHSAIPEIRDRLITENNSLKQMMAALDKGVNPFKQPKPEAQTANQGKPCSSSSDSGNPEKDKEGEHKFFSREYPKTTLNDIAGLDEVKDQIRLNVLLPIHNPELYFKYKDKAGCNILMYGPPGCGKSFICEAIAGELKCAYAVINANDIMDKYVGEAPKKIKAIFEEANEYDNCLLFFDEVDALCASRDSDDSAHTKDILTTFLTCLSGFGTKDKDKVRVIIAATNRPWALDSALIRGQRLDTHIYVTLPDAEARKFMISRSLKKHPDMVKDTDITLEYMVEKTEGYSGADITSIIEGCKTQVLKNAASNLANGIDKDEVLTIAIFDNIMSKKRNTVSEEDLARFEAFKEGII